MADQKAPDPWAEAAKGYKPEPGQSAPAAANDDWKVWQQDSEPTQEQQGFVDSALDSSGLSSIGHAFAHPKEAGKGMIDRALDPNADLIHSVTAMRDAYKSGGGVKGIARAFVDSNPLVSPLGTAEKQYDAKNYSGMAGTITGAVAPWLLPEGAETAAAKIPTRAKAGELFKSVMQDAAKEPVTLTRSKPILERAMQLSDAGHGTITPLDKLYSRINQTQPLEYSEARDRASALSSLTGEDKMRATKTLRSEAKQLSHAFNDDVGDAAASVGRGEDYAKAMKQYRQASRANSFIKRAAIPLAVGAGTAVAGPQIARYLKSAF